MQGCQILANVTSADYTRIIKILEEAILSTDLAVYFGFDPILFNYPRFHSFYSFSFITIYYHSSRFSSAPHGYCSFAVIHLRQLSINYSMRCFVVSCKRYWLPWPNVGVALDLITVSLRSEVVDSCYSFSSLICPVCWRYQIKSSVSGIDLNVQWLIWVLIIDLKDGFLMVIDWYGRLFCCPTLWSSVLFINYSYWFW